MQVTYLLPTDTAFDAFLQRFSANTAQVSGGACAVGGPAVRTGVCLGLGWRVAFAGLPPCHTRAALHPSLPRAQALLLSSQALRALAAYHMLDSTVR